MNCQTYYGRRRQLILRGWCLLALLMSGMPPPVNTAPPGQILTTAREVRRLDDDARRAAPPVRLRGVVLRCWKNGPNFMLQDETDAIFVDLSRANAPGKASKLPLAMDIGSVVEVEDVAAAGMFAPIVVVQSELGIRVVGTAPLPCPLPLTAEAALAGLNDGHLVVIEGVVRQARSAAGSHATYALEMVFESTRLVVFLTENHADGSGLVDARIRITGISSGIWNKQGQITAPCLQVRDLRDITVLRAAPADPFALPVRSVANIMRYRPEDAPGHRMHIAGVVLHALPDGCVFVFDGARSVCVETFRRDPPAGAGQRAAPGAGSRGQRRQALGCPHHRSPPRPP